LFQVLKLRRDNTVMHRDPERSTEVEETFQGSRINKLKRNSAFSHRATAERNRRRENPLEGLEVEKLMRDDVLRIQARPKFTGFTEETKVEVFWSKKIFQVQEEEKKLRRELQLLSDLAWIADSHWIQEELHEV
jgi:hypothetical protein